MKALFALRIASPVLTDASKDTQKREGHLVVAEHVLYEKSNEIVLITINRPRQRKPGSI